MKKLSKIILFLFLGTFILFTSCERDDSNVEGDSIDTGSTIIGWNDASQTLSYFTNIGVLNNTYAVNVLGGGDGSPTTSDISVSVSVDPSSTAIAGQEYSLPSSGITIPAGGTFANVPVDINTGGFNATSPTFLLLNIETTANGTVVSSLNSQLKINFVGCKSTIGDYSYMVTIVREDGLQYGPLLENVLEESVNSFLTYSVGTWNPPLNAGHGVRFEVICGEILIADQELADMYSNAVTGIGTTMVDPATGDFTINYMIDFASGGRSYSATYIRQ